MKGIFLSSSFCRTRSATIFNQFFCELVKAKKWTNLNSYLSWIAFRIWCFLQYCQIARSIVRSIDIPIHISFLLHYFLMTLIYYHQCFIAENIIREHRTGEVSAYKWVPVFPVFNWPLVLWKKIFCFDRNDLF